MARTQFNLRVSAQLEMAIDEKRTELRAPFGTIPSRTNIRPAAAVACRGISLGESEADRHTTAGPAERRAR
ncbi:MAG: hypothetical protein OJF60_000068 [Burkholderiaceae bacterium]|nr:MAG: hypothetical protein OJF60_000068 [Burkholderiaceae bacterium]